jgi:hypothetical protein
MTWAWHCETCGKRGRVFTATILPSGKDLADRARRDHSLVSPRCCAVKGKIVQLLEEFA